MVRHEFAQMIKLDRRLLLAAFSASLLPYRALAAPGTPSGIRLGPPKDFSFASLAARAKKAATQPYKAPQARATQIIKGIDFDAAQKIRFRADHALWPGRPDPVSFFHLSRYSADPVVLYAVQDGKAREILYGPDYFDYSASGLDAKALGSLGFSGFRVMDGPDKPTDWLAFQGASYFRSSGQEAQYGASARGIAINTAAATAEEFPRFSEFWLDENGPVISIYALLDGPSITGAYKFDAMKNGAGSGGAIMNVHCDLFFRADISRLGVAPLTSMYWYGENERPKAADWRPEIHDNDGLALWTGKGERIWRPLVNPPQVMTNSFADENPKGFGLMQRDRDFADYQDDGAFYNKRPSIWVEPRGNWGPGAVQLVEIPTEDETHDNIVAYWRPDRDIHAGDTMSFDYRLYWQNNEPAYPRSIAKSVATRLGRGGIPGANPWPRDKHKFVVDFTGGSLMQMQQRFDVTPVVSASRGKVDNAYVVKVVGTDRWRALFDLQLDGTAPADLRLYLKLGNKTLSETWLYQYFPS
jgi:glucans biosynthesis protein